MLGVKEGVWTLSPWEMQAKAKARRIIRIVMIVQ